MRIRLPGIGLVVMMALAAESVNFAPAQGETPPGSNSVNVQSAPGENVARIHWIGTDQIERDTNAAQLIGIWNIPESAKLQAQTLDKLSAAPWRLLHRPPDTNGAALLRPLLEDVLHRECYLQARQARDQPVQIAFAIRLDDRRAALWQSNLAAVLISLTGIQPVNAKGAAGGSLQKHHPPSFIQWNTVGGWIVLGAATDRNPLFSEFVSRIRDDRVPLGTGVTRDWLQADLDLARLSAALSTHPSPRPEWPRISVSAVGEGTNLHTRAKIQFPNPLPIGLDPWNVPASIMDSPLDSFTAARGFRNWLESLPAWLELKTGPSPNQFYIWALQGPPVYTFAAAPLSNASNAVYQATDRVLDQFASWFATNELAKFVRSDSFNGLQWRGAPWLEPTLQSLAVSNHGDFVFAGLFPNLPSSPPPPHLFDETLNRTNLVYYDWELTRSRTEQWFYIGQFARYASGREQMPSECMGVHWLTAIAPRLGPSVTRATAVGASKLCIDRTSTMGFTGIELHLLADWLESPQFPIGLHTFPAAPAL